VVVQLLLLLIILRYWWKSTVRLRVGHLAFA